MVKAKKALGDIGELFVENPTVFCVLRKEGSNYLNVGLSV